MLPSHTRLAIAMLAMLATRCGKEEQGDQCMTERSATALEGAAPHCVDIAVSTLHDGTSACRAFAGSNRDECDCSAGGRQKPFQDSCRLDLNVSGDTKAFSCVCELTQLSGVALQACLGTEADDTDGWCYAARSPECGPAASDDVTSACTSGQRFKLQGGAALASDETLLLSCTTLSCAPP